jgi:parallel beta-helix repeat protein
MKIVKKIMRFIFITVVIFFIAGSSAGNTYAYYQLPDVFQAATSIPVQNGFFYSFLPLVIKQYGNIFFVSTNGSDNNPGTLNLPWRTLNKAASMLEPGDIVFIRGGIYQEAVDFSGSGTSKTPIKILAYPGETPIIDGNNYSIPRETGGALLELSGNYIYASGLEVRYSSYLGVLLNGSHSVANKINSNHNFHSGMRIAGDYSIIEYSQVWSNDMQNYNGKNGGDSTALTAARQPNYAIIRNNVVYGNWGIGLSTYEANGTIIEGNVVFDNYFTNIYLSDATNVLFQRNFIYATGNMSGGSQIGIQVGDETSNPPSENITIINNIVYGTNRNLACWKGSTRKMTNVLIANNTFVNSSEESNVIIAEGLSFNNVSFINNIIQQDNDLQLILLPTDHPGLSFSNNLWSKTPRKSASSPTDIIGDPLFTETGDPYSPEWFMLSNNSPAINRALSLPNITNDYFLNLREPAPDMGAHEFTHP